MPGDTMQIRPRNEAFSVTAHWFVPENPERKILGTLQYVPGRISLELVDTFAALQGAVYGNESLDYPLLFGQTHAGEQFTLIRPERVGYTFALGPAGFVQPDRFTARAMIAGTFTDVDPVLPELSCRVPGLAEWLSRPTIYTTYDLEGKSISMRVAALDDEKVRVPSLSADLVFDVNSNVKPAPFAMSISTSGSLRFVPDTPQPLSWYLRNIVSVTAFLSLCAGIAMPPDCITIPTQERQNRASLLLRGAIERYCDIKDYRLFFLARGAFTEQFGSCLARWFEIYPQYEITNGLAMSILGSDHLWPHIEFMSLMQALEGFHRVGHDGLYMDESKYKAVADAIVAAIPTEVDKDHRTSLKSRVRYGNEIALGKRLTLLCAGLEKPLRTMLFGDSEKLLRRWVDTRNYYTHWDVALRDQILDGQNLIYAIARLRSLLRVLYLNAMGVPQDIILQALTGISKEAQFLIQIRGVERRESDPNDTTGAFMFIQRGAPTAPVEKNSESE
jgi:hypothetical protein